MVHFGGIWNGDLEVGTTSNILKPMKLNGALEECGR